MRIVFAGTPGFSIPCLQALSNADGMEVVGVVSQPDRRSGRGMRLTPSPVKQAALDAGIDTITPENLWNDAESLAWLEAKKADMLVVVAFGMILPKPWLDAPAIAPVNVHASLLPRWRGAAPIERALLAGDTKTGVCIMHMEEGLDTGGVYASQRLPITQVATGPDLWAALAPMGAQLLVDTLPKIAAGSLKMVPQDDAKATYAAKLSSDERIIDWRLSADAIDRQVRCFSPKPGARARLNGKWLKIIRGTPLQNGLIRKAGALAHTDSLDVACGKGTLYRVFTVQPEGKKVMPAEAFLRGNSITPGQCFDVNDAK
ncbi:MAG: methionyl-tRNA formyltransferase [Mariprofundaceae bacterium]|nr:methionyl-tRNA formyltransferase [Mariprofundaceae bacterium]